MSKVVEDVISDNFCLKKYPPENQPKMGSETKKKILNLEANSAKFWIHNLGRWGGRGERVRERRSRGLLLFKGKMFF